MAGRPAEETHRGPARVRSENGPSLSSPPQKPSGCRRTAGSSPTHKFATSCSRCIRPAVAHAATAGRAAVSSVWRSSSWLQQGIRLTKIRKLLARQGVVIPYATLHRFAVVELSFGRAATTIPVVDGAPGEELQVDTGWVGWLDAHRPEAPLSGVDLHGGPLALSVCVSDLRGVDGARHRSVRGGLGPFSAASSRF